MKGQLLLAILAIIILVKGNHETVKKILSHFETGPTKELFKVYHFLFKKEYDLNSEEGLRRYTIFKENLAFIKKVNSENHSFTLGITQFTDLTHQEFQQRKPKFFPNSSRSLREVFFDQDADEEIQEINVTEVNQGPIDWRKHLGPPRDQGPNCFSCWAFTTAAVLEGATAIKNGGKITEYLSPQQMVDCSKQDWGCNGGNPQYTLTFTKTNGICKDVDYPYTAKDGRCKTNMKNEVINARGMELCGGLKGPCTKASWTSLLAKGPIAAIMDGYSEMFQHYTEGILKGSELPCREHNHAVTVVGFANDVITVRNSFGTNWGEGGNFRISYNDSCFINEGGILPLL